MSLRLARASRWSLVVAALALGVSAAGCASASAQDTTGASTSSITQVTQSSVKRQSIGNCWIYATASWSESMNENATGQEPTFSESYWTYWHWFEQIANGEVGSTISTGGTFGTAAELINRYGVMNAGDFIAVEATAEMSDAQARAETAIDQSLKSGALSDPAARRDRAKVRAELNAAWGLDPAVVAQLDQVFGADVSRTLDRAAQTDGTSVRAAQTIPIKVWDERSQADVTATLQDAIGTGSAWSRAGALAWNEVSYPSDAQRRRDFQKRFQRALHHSVPVIMSWYVDFNAMEPGGQFRAPPAQPGRQGGHMVVMSDYQVSNVPGFGTLPAGVLETRPEALAAALDDAATIDFIRIKNSWGTLRVDRNFTSGYHDLWMTYLNGPVQQCQVDADENPIAGTCSPTTPFEAVVLPPGF